MTIQTTVNERATILRIGGRMDAESYTSFDDAFNQAVSGGAVNIVTDLSGLVYISSAGVGSLVRALKLLQPAQGEVLLAGVNGLVRDVLVLTHIINLFRVFDSVDAAVAAVR